MLGWLWHSIGKHADVASDFTTEQAECSSDVLTKASVHALALGIGQAVSIVNLSEVVRTMFDGASPWFLQGLKDCWSGKFRN